MFWFLFIVITLLLVITITLVVKHQDRWTDGSIWGGIGIGLALPGISLIVAIVLRIIGQKDRTRIGLGLSIVIYFCIGSLIIAILNN